MYFFLSYQDFEPDSFQIRDWSDGWLVALKSSFWIVAALKYDATSSFFVLLNRFVQFLSPALKFIQNRAVHQSIVLEKKCLFKFTRPDAIKIGK